MWTKFQVIFNTIKHLRWLQVRYQVLYRLRGKLGIQPRLRAYRAKSRAHIVVGQINTSLFDQLAQHKKKTIEFNFLNLTQEFERDKIDWNFHEYGKLWTYNLNYFEFLLSDQMSCDEGISLIENYIDNWHHLKDGIEPFPISLRTINWVKFLSKHEVKNEKIDEKLYQQVQILLNNLEYHILANHLLENAFSLIFAAYYFQDEHIYSKAKTLLLDQLEEQILNDGGHYERSPMYHQIMLFRLLDVVSLVQCNPWKNHDILNHLELKAQSMVNWLSSMTLSSGEIPHVKDSAPNIAPGSKELFAYANNLGFKFTQTSELKDSGYRWLKSSDSLCMLIDVGNISPSYQPGHAHADELNFLLYENGNPVIVDTGISTYEKNERRQLERSTQSHNCVSINGKDSSEVWGGFRVGRRAKVSLITDEDNEIKAHHDGYGSFGLITRAFTLKENSFNIELCLPPLSNQETITYLHFHPKFNPKIINNKIIEVNNIEILLEGFYDVRKESYMLAFGFNHLIPSYKVVLRSKSKNLIKIKHAN